MSADDLPRWRRRTLRSIISPGSELHWAPICRRFSTESGYPQLRAFQVSRSQGLRARFGRRTLVLLISKMQPVRNGEQRGHHPGAVGCKSNKLTHG